MKALTRREKKVSLSQSNFQLHKPYDQARQNRYSNSNGVERFWVYSNDKPFKQGSPTKPRTEMRISGHDYTSGVWQFEGNFYVPSGTTGACIMQVFGAANQATSLQLRVYDGDLKVYRSQVVASNIYNRWFKLNVIHDVGNSRVTIFIDNAQKVVEGGKGASNFYFKFGVYAQDGSSNYMESRWSGIKVFKK
ncbi:Alginate lyase [Trema orientale]|uniref:Alginate lyase n=1 Tax=Trema orientale TaxID=63057 RepID=A0A2P5FES9_TREOI|nr:Alginate lyase [Trema orientale]